MHQSEKPFGFGVMTPGSHVCFSFAPAEGALAVSIRSFTTGVGAASCTASAWS